MMQMHSFYEETLVAYREGELPLFTELPRRVGFSETQPYLEVPVELALPETNPERTPATVVTPSSKPASLSTFNERNSVEVS